jgi:tRNA modification GTPase
LFFPFPLTDRASEKRTSAEEYDDNREDGHNIMAFEKVDLPDPEDTIVALCSAPGAGTRAIVRLSGPEAHRITAAIFRPIDGDSSTSPAQADRRRVIPGSVFLQGVSAPLPAWLYRFFAPRSYTGQDMAEIHTLGSPPLVEHLIAELLRSGARAARPGEFTLRAFLAGKKDLAQAEAIRAVIEADDQSDLQRALQQLAGGLSGPLQALRDDLLNLLADLEANLDFVDEDITFLTPQEAFQRIQDGIDRLQGLLQQLQGRQIAGRLPRIVLVGPPNAGKSSLFNALSGAQALVSPMPGTTRDYLTHCCDLEGVRVELVDTAGWQPAGNGIEEQAQHLARQAAEHADVILWCDEKGVFLPPDHPQSPEAWSSAIVVRVRTKADLPSDTHPSLTAGAWPADVACSVISAEGLHPLRLFLREKLATRPPSSLAPGSSRCQHHLEVAVRHLQAAAEQIVAQEPLEFPAAALRAALHQLGELTGVVYTNELLDRIFSRFCIGK